MATEIPFSSWDDFKVRWVSEVRGRQEAEYKKTVGPGAVFSMSKLFLFRGQRLANRPLRSSFDRVMADHGLGRNDFIENRFTYFMEQFRIARTEAGLGGRESVYSAGSLGDPASPTPSMLSLAAIAQHSGLPTRLLDWSRSPYVAAFFAVSKEAASGSHAAIWCMDFGRLMAEKCIRDHNVMIWDAKGFGNMRQIAQHGAFSLNSTNEMDLENVFLRNSSFMHRDPKTEVLFKMTIPHTERNPILYDLDFMRINYSSLFPDEDGVVKHMNWRLNEREFSNPGDTFA